MTSDFKQLQTNASDLLYNYLYEEYRRERYKKIRKRSHIVTAVTAEKRKMILDYANHKRELHGLMRGKVKFYNQVSLVDLGKERKYIISGGNLVENLYGLAWENEIVKGIGMPQQEMRLVEKIQNSWIGNKTWVFPNSVLKYDKGVSHSKGYNCTEISILIIADDYDKTHTYTKLNWYSEEYIQFRKEIARFEELKKQGT